MQRQILAAEHHAAFAREVYLMRAVGQQQPFALLDIFNKGGNAVDIHRGRGGARQPHNNSDIGVVALAG